MTHDTLGAVITGGWLVIFCVVTLAFPVSSVADAVIRVVSSTLILAALLYYIHRRITKPQHRSRSTPTSPGDSHDT